MCDLEEGSWAFCARVKSHPPKKSHLETSIWCLRNNKNNKNCAIAQTRFSFTVQCNRIFSLSLITTDTRLMSSESLSCHLRPLPSLLSSPLLLMGSYFGPIPPSSPSSSPGHGVAPLSVQISPGYPRGLGLTCTLRLWFSPEGLVLFQARVIGAECGSLQL